MSDRWDPATLLEALSSDAARDILVAAADEEVTAEDLATRCGVSLPTVYRHVDDLTDADLLVERTNIDADGNHYKTVETTVEEVCVTVTGDGVSLSVDEQEPDLIDRFEGFWRDLDESTAGDES